MKICRKAVKKLDRMRVIISLCILVLLNLVFFGFASNVVFAQSTPYSVSGTAQPVDTEFFVIYEVNANDRVLVSINPSSAAEYYNSYVYFPNQTQIYQEYTQQYAHGSHSYNFVAAVSGNYVVSFNTGTGTFAGAGFNYTINSSHVISNLSTRQATPFSIKGLAQPVQSIQQDIYDVKANDIVLITISPSSAAEYYNSYVYFPNQTQIYQEYTQQYAHGSHSYNFVAAVSGNYVVSFNTGTGTFAGAGFNYTINSSHVISNLSTRQATPFSIKGLAQPVQSIQQDIYDVKANDIVLITISPSSAAEYYNSYVYFPNQTQIYQEYTQQYAHGSHSYNFVAAVSGNYVVSFNTGTGTFAGAGFNYTIKSSHPLTVGQTQQDSTPTITTPPTPLPPININTIQGDEVNFTIQSSYGPYTIDFGDGNTNTTSGQSISHTYKTAGNYTVMITIPQNTGEKIIQTYIVTVAPKTTEKPTSIIDQFTDLRVIVAIISTIIGAIGLYIAIKTYRGRQTRNENKPTPPPPIDEKETKTNNGTVNT